MVFHKTPFEHITGKLQKFHAITNPLFEIKFPFSIGKHACDVVKVINKINFIVTRTILIVSVVSLSSVYRGTQRHDLPLKSF